MPEIPMPEIPVVKTPLQFFWIADQSGSMDGRKIVVLNEAIRSAVEETKAIAKTHPEVDLSMRAIRFSDEAAWHIGPNPVPIEKFIWSHLKAAGKTSTAKAIRLLTKELAIDKLKGQQSPPVCVLISDGECTDPQDHYDAAIKELLALPWGMKAIRLAIGIGGDEAYNHDELLKFVSHREYGVLDANTPGKLVLYIKWIATQVTQSSMHTKSSVADSDSHVELPPLPDEPIACPIANANEPF